MNRKRQASMPEFIAYLTGIGSLWFLFSAFVIMAEAFESGELMLLRMLFVFFGTVLLNITLKIIGFEVLVHRIMKNRVDFSGNKRAIRSFLKNKVKQTINVTSIFVWVFMSGVQTAFVSVVVYFNAQYLDLLIVNMIVYGLVIICVPRVCRVYLFGSLYHEYRSIGFSYQITSNTGEPSVKPVIETFYFPIKKYEHNILNKIYHTNNGIAFETPTKYVHQDKHTKIIGKYGAKKP